MGWVGGWHRSAAEQCYVLGCELECFDVVLFRLCCFVLRAAGHCVYALNVLREVGLGFIFQSSPVLWRGQSRFASLSPQVV